MKTFFFSLLILFSTALSAQLDWLQVNSSASLLTTEHFLGVATSPAGDVYAVGTLVNSPNTYGYLQKYSAAGVPAYGRVLGTANGVAYDAAYDRANNRLAVAGEHNGKPYLELIDPTTGATHSTAPFTGSGVIKGLDVTSNYIYAIGNYSGTLAFGSVLSITGGGAFVAQLDLNGNAIRVINIQGIAKGFDVKADAAGDIFFSLTTSGDIPFGTGFPGNYTYSGSGEDQVLVRANGSMQAQWSTLMRNSNFPLTEESELPVALDEGVGVVYAATPYEPNTTPTLHASIASFQLATGVYNQGTVLPLRTVRDLVVNCGELFATGGRAQSFARAPCGVANHEAWYESFGSTLTSGGVSSATACSYNQAITADDFGNIVMAGGFKEATNLTWDGLTENALLRGGAMVAHLPTDAQCCTQSTDICLRFDGFQDNISFTNSPIQSRTEFTIETWFQNEDSSVPPAGPGFFKHLFSNNGNSFGVGVRGGQLAVRAASGNINTILPILNDQWYHLAVVFENNTLTTYLDCQQVDQRTANLILFNDFFIGQHGGTGSLENWEGRMDEFSVYDHARGIAEIMAQKDCRRSGSEDGLVLYLPFDQGLPGQPNPTVITAFDLSASANNGTLGNFVLNNQQSNWVCSRIALGAPCPPPPCNQPLPVNTFSLYQETRDVGVAAGTPQFDLAYGAFRLPSGDIIFGGVVQGADAHNPIYFAKTDDRGNLIGNPDLYHPITGEENIALPHAPPTPIRDASGNITGFLGSHLHESLPGQPEQRVLLWMDLNLNVINSRVYQGLVTGAPERFTDIIQDSNGDFLAIGEVNQSPFKAGFAMRIRADLSIDAYELIQDFSKNIYLDKIIEARYNFGGMFGGIVSTYIVGGHDPTGDLFFQGLDFNLQPVSNTVGVSEPSSGSNTNLLAGMVQRSDGALVLVGSSKDGRAWISLFPPQTTWVSPIVNMIDIDNGTEEILAVASLSGDRILIGGRGEIDAVAGTSSDNAVMLEYDLQTASVNWVRTYGNTAYPESLIVDIYADDDGFLLTGYGLTATGVTTPGFNLQHLDSWLAATDTLGRVFDCDCYEDSYAIATAIPYAFGGPSLEFIAANKGQDDLAQDRTKATVANYFCDQYNSVVSPVCCGGEDRDRMQLVIDTEISEEGDDWFIINDDLPECFSLIVDWGDGSSETFEATELPARHTYAEDGNYNICVVFQALAQDGTVCWEEERCDAVTGTDERSPAVDLTVYPNPTSGMLHLRFPQEYGVPSATIFSASGQLVKSVDRQERETLSLVGLPSGAYILFLRFPGGEIARRRVMLTR